MTPYVLKYLPKEDLKVFEEVRQAIIALPDVDLGNDEKGRQIILSCHILARAVAKVFSLEYSDGYFSHDRSYQHSWVLTKNRNIIDVYPVGIVGGPFLVDATSCYNSLGPYLYRDQDILSAKEKKRFNAAIDIISVELERLRAV